MTFERSRTRRESEVGTQKGKDSSRDESEQVEFADRGERIA